MDADGDAQRRGQFCRQFLADSGQIVENVGRRGDGLTTRFIARCLKAEDRHCPVADKLVEPPAGALHGLADNGEVAVEQEDCVEGQAPVGQRGETADIAK